MLIFIKIKFNIFCLLLSLIKYITCEKWKNYINLIEPEILHFGTWLYIKFGVL